MTLDQLTAKESHAAQPGCARPDRHVVEDQMTAALVERQTPPTRRDQQAKSWLVVSTPLKGDTTEGEDGELYAAMGYVRERTRQPAQQEPTTKPTPAVVK